MNDERLAELQEKYKDRNLFEELAWGAYANHSGYTSKQNGEFLNWLCTAAYKALKEKPTGKWICVHPLQEDDGGAYMCSVCKTGDWNIRGDENFCPHCGADMRGGKE